MLEVSIFNIFQALFQNAYFSNRVDKVIITAGKCTYTGINITNIAIYVEVLPVILDVSFIT